MSVISVRLLVDKGQKRVVFAESGSDFIDVLFSFLTLPLGNIVRLLGKQTGLGSLDNLYESVEQLEVKHLQTEACQEMLLKPRSAAARICEDLKIKNIHDPNPRTFYICKEAACLTQSVCYYSYVKEDRCSRCGKLMDKVMPISLMSGFSQLEELQIKDVSILEEMVVEVGSEEVLALLSATLISKTVLTDVFSTKPVYRKSY